MNKRIEDGGPVFPVVTDSDGARDYGHPAPENLWQFGGMTLRDYFAAKVLPSLASEMYSWGGRLVETDIPTVAATVAYGFADAMLKARES